MPDRRTLQTLSPQVQDGLVPLESTVRNDYDTKGESPIVGRAPAARYEGTTVCARALSDRCLASYQAVRRGS
jgi:hypothetical protein